MHGIGYVICRDPKRLIVENEVPLKRGFGIEVTQV